MMTGLPRSTGGSLPWMDTFPGLTVSLPRSIPISLICVTLTQYHSSVLGHGILISELERRVLRIEEHLHLPPVADN
jgi:hypothetical protein